MIMKKFIELEAEGQIMIGDDLVIIGKSPSDSQVVKVEGILEAGDEVGGTEEIIIDRELNRYFITDMYLKGESWADDVFIIELVKD